MTDAHIVMHGTPVQGFLFVGPFDSYDEALEYAEQIRYVEWWVIPLTGPVELN